MSKHGHVWWLEVELQLYRMSCIACISRLIRLSGKVYASSSTESNSIKFESATQMNHGQTCKHTPKFTLQLLLQLLNKVAEFVEL